MQAKSPAKNHVSISARHKNPPCGKTKHRQKSNRSSVAKNDANGPLLNSLESMNAEGAAYSCTRETRSMEDSAIPTSCLGDTTKNPSTTLAVPLTEHCTLESANNANTFLDSVLNLCRKSLISCCDSDEGLGGEFIFLELVKLLGLIQAKHWADGLGIPNQKSYALLAHILYGQTLPKKDPLASFTTTLAK
jgi:hypothetical protein